MESTSNKWRNFSRQVFEEPIPALIENVIIQEQKDGHGLKICAGSDSQAYKSYVAYGTVIVVLRKEKGTPKIGTKERMLREVTLSVEAAYSICDILEKYDVEPEVHADINTDPKFESNIALKEAMGYILGMGFVFKA